jgi:iron complex transport system ATP-binding protein
VPSQRDTEIALQALATVGLQALARERYTQISGGERQLALIARALAQEPQVLLLDEPTSHLDFGNQMLVLETVRRLAGERGLTVLMATHAPDHALFVADRVALMKGGGFLAVGPPGQVMTEDNLRVLYRIDIRMVTVAGDDGATLARAAVALPGGARRNEVRE